MHPNVFLKTLWRLEIRNEVFVAMSFADRYKQRYESSVEWAPPTNNGILCGWRVVGSAHPAPLRSLLSTAVLDEYIRRASERARDWPHKKREKPSGIPKTRPTAMPEGSEHKELV